MLIDEKFKKLFTMQITKTRRTGGAAMGSLGMLRCGFSYHFLNNINIARLVDHTNSVPLVKRSHVSFPCRSHMFRALLGLFSFLVFME